MKMIHRIHFFDFVEEKSITVEAARSKRPPYWSRLLACESAFKNFKTDCLSLSKVILNFRKALPTSTERWVF
jgi:hypothetical protein